MVSITILSVLSQALYNRLVPSVNGVRRFSPIQISRLRVSRSKTVPKSAVVIILKGELCKRCICPLGGPMSFVWKVAFSFRNNGWMILMLQDVQCFSDVFKVSILNLTEFMSFFITQYRSGIESFIKINFQPLLLSLWNCFDLLYYGTKNTIALFLPKHWQMIL